MSNFNYQPKTCSYQKHNDGKYAIFCTMTEEYLKTLDDPSTDQIVIDVVNSHEEAIVRITQIKHKE